LADYITCNCCEYDDLAHLFDLVWLKSSHKRLSRLDATQFHLFLELQIQKRVAKYHEDRRQKNEGDRSSYRYGIGCDHVDDLCEVKPVESVGQNDLDQDADVETYEDLHEAV
jgi:hypothetical protein